MSELTFLSKEEKRLLNEVITYYSYQYFTDIGFNENGDPISYNDDHFNLELFKSIQSISKKLRL